MQTRWPVINEALMLWNFLKVHCVSCFSPSSYLRGEKNLSKCNQDLWVYYRTLVTRVKLCFRISFLKEMESQGKSLLWKRRGIGISNPRWLQRKTPSGIGFKEVIRSRASWSECTGFSHCAAATAPSLVHVLCLQVSQHLQTLIPLGSCSLSIFLFLWCEWLTERSCRSHFQENAPSKGNLARLTWR